MSALLSTAPSVSNEEPLQDVLARIEAEMQSVADLIERLEPQINRAHGTELIETPEQMKILQGIDLAVQKTRGLAEFLGTLSGSMSAQWEVDIATALNLVKLADMQAALRSGMVDDAQAEVDEDGKKNSGDLEFF